MPFTSYTYILFLIAAVVVVRLVRGVAREWVLLGASLLYYAAWDPRFLAVLLGLGVFTYLAGGALARDRKNFRRLMLSLGLILLVLSVFKYTGMIAEFANLLLPRQHALPVPNFILPLGISFFTFECVSYLLDIFKGGKELVPLRRFLLFPAFWPHMVAGPILRLKEFAPQLDSPKEPTADDVLVGVDRIAIGLVKKMVIANTLAAFVDQGFGASEVSAVDAWALTIAFGLQIYFDFSSYSDIAIGSARLVGFTFPENFNLPYHSQTPSEFWNRWHMTLSRWIRDYVFFPLNMKAGRRIWLRYAALVFVMTLVGLWHGAGITFILWGTWHGVLMVGHRLLQPLGARISERWQRVTDVASWGVTFLLVQAGWVLFRAPTIARAASMLRSLVAFDRLKPAFSVNDYLLLVLWIGAYFALEPLWKRLFEKDASAPATSRASLFLRPVAYAAAIQLIFLFDKSNVSFIYFQF